MKLSAPIHVLKSQAKSLKKVELITMTEALNKIATQEGFSSWSLLQSKRDSVLPNSYDEVLDKKLVQSPGAGYRSSSRCTCRIPEIHRGTGAHRL